MHSLRAFCCCHNIQKAFNKYNSCDAPHILKLLLRTLHNHDKQSIVCCFTCTNFIHGNSRYRFIVIIFKHNCFALYRKTRGFLIFCKSNFLMSLQYLPTIMKKLQINVYWIFKRAVEIICFA